MKIVILGYGHVGQGFIELLRTQAAALEANYDFKPQITAVVARRGWAHRSTGLDLDADLKLNPGLVPLDDLLADAEVLVELTPTDVHTGGPGLEHIRRALNLGKHVVTANKGPLVVAYRELAALAQSKGVQFRFEGTVLGGSPAMVLGLEILKPAGVQSVRGIVNGTTNFILTQMETGGSYADALQTAQQLGYAETDPTGDVEGWDAAAKAVILANTLFGGDLRIGDVDREGITGITSAMVNEARAANQRWKLIAQVSGVGDGVAASVHPTLLPLSDPLSQVGGGLNALTYSTTALGDVTLVGPGAGGQATGFAVLSDLLKIQRATRQD